MEEEKKVTDSPAVKKPPVPSTRNATKSITARSPSAANKALRSPSAASNQANNKLVAKAKVIAKSSPTVKKPVLKKPTVTNTQTAPTKTPAPLVPPIRKTITPLSVGKKSTGSKTAIASSKIENENDVAAIADLQASVESNSVVDLTGSREGNRLSAMLTEENKV